jgi:hypothetical protein
VQTLRVEHLDVPGGRDDQPGLSQVTEDPGDGRPGRTDRIGKGLLRDVGDQPRVLTDGSEIEEVSRDPLAQGAERVVGHRPIGLGQSSRKLLSEEPTDRWLISPQLPQRPGVQHQQFGVRDHLNTGWNRSPDDDRDAEQLPRPDIPNRDRAAIWSGEESARQAGDDQGTAGLIGIPIEHATGGELDRERIGEELVLGHDGKLGEQALPNSALAAIHRGSQDAARRGTVPSDQTGPSDRVPRRSRDCDFCHRFNSSSGGEHRENGVAR